MPDIRVLDPHVADLIAAGEVVERPASAAKELCENAVDAGASKITVEIQRGGMAFLRVTDDGRGIPAAQLKTAFLRHATSKLRHEYDLEAIGTLGFRGEALAAISAVSRMDVLTRTPETPLGASLSLEGGVPGEVEEAGCPLGTTMVVRDLFYNTPARLKFMKKDAAEGAAVFAAVQRIALSHPEVSVKFIRDGKQEMLTPGDGKLQSAVYAVLGRELALGFREVRAAGEDLSVTGFVSLPACCRGSRGWQFFFVNGRHIKSKLLTAALEEAYKNQKMVGKFPACVLHIRTKLNAVDVNVHPAKTEVKFGAERQVFSAVYHAVLSALEGDRSHLEMKMQNAEGRMQNEAIPGVRRASDSVTANQVRLPLSPASPRVQVHDSAFRGQVKLENLEQLAGLTRREMGKAAPGTPAPVPAETKGAVDRGPFSQPSGRTVPYPLCPSGTSPLDKGSRPPRGELAGAPPKKEAETEEAVPAPPKVSEPPAEPERSLPAGKPGPEPLLPEEPAWRVAGEVLNTYIIVEQGDTVYFIDKHAAHERMNFDRMKAEGYDPMAQTLLAPVVCRLAAEEREVLLAHRDLLEEFGFDVDELGGGLAVRQAPFDVDAGDIPASLEEIARKLLTGGSADPAAVRDELLHTMACKAAIKGGWHSSPQELERVARAVLSGRVKYCPHGRPVAIRLTRKELEKQFRRS